MRLNEVVRELQKPTESCEDGMALKIRSELGSESKSFISSAWYPEHLFHFFENMLSAILTLFKVCFVN